MAARRILTLAACTLISARGNASPRTDPTSGRAVFTGATSEHASSLTLSPAALALANSHELYFALTSTLAQTRIQSAGADISDATIAPGGVISYLRRVSEGLRIGIE